ncbi:hypothetical protein MCOR14_009109 [Pyricularia oryzae]|nr:hypothetical protein MCOR34_010519 [Pyricularia oryzae]KAI6506075.1 hypothetical protein MCOR13_003744 [Pyricularia oryzae]KAI6625394.1 hypothetical protein MCOR14_009109 [Pyricularia oryzae]
MPVSCPTTFEGTNEITRHLMRGCGCIRADSDSAGSNLNCPATDGIAANAADKQDKLPLRCMLLHIYRHQASCDGAPAGLRNQRRRMFLSEKASSNSKHLRIDRYTADNFFLSTYFSNRTKSTKSPYANKMLIKESHADVQTTVNGVESTMRIFVFHPTIPQYPNARFPGVVIFSEIYQVTGPVARFARQIAGQGYIVAAPSSYHDFTGPEPLAYDVPGTDQGNEWKIKKTLESYDEDSHKSVDYLLSLPTCTGLIGATGMCLGGHLALRASLDPRISACVAYFATDVHSRTLGPYESANTAYDAPANSNHTIDHFSKIKAEVAMIFGIKDTHVPDAGRDLIRRKLREAGTVFSFYEFAWAQHAFIRDELSKGRYDPAITKVCFEVLLELFGRTLKTDLGPRDATEQKVEHVC